MSFPFKVTDKFTLLHVEGSRRVPFNMSLEQLGLEKIEDAEMSETYRAEIKFKHTTQVNFAIEIKVDTRVQLVESVRVDLKNCIIESLPDFWALGPEEFTK